MFCLMIIVVQTDLTCQKKWIRKNGSVALWYNSVRLSQNLRVTVLEGSLFGPEKSLKKVITWSQSLRICDFGPSFIVGMDQNRIFEEFWVRWSKISERKSVYQNRDAYTFMPSHDYLLHTPFWTKKWTPSIHAILTKNIEIVPTEIGHGAFDSVLVDFVPILFVQ